MNSQPSPKFLQPEINPDIKQAKEQFEAQKKDKEATMFFPILIVGVITFALAQNIWHILPAMMVILFPVIELVLAFVALIAGSIAATFLCPKSCALTSIAEHVYELKLKQPQLEAAAEAYKKNKTKEHWSVVIALTELMGEHISAIGTNNKSTSAWKPTVSQEAMVAAASDYATNSEARIKQLLQDLAPPEAHQPDVAYKQAILEAPDLQNAGNDIKEVISINEMKWNEQQQIQEETK